MASCWEQLGKLISQAVKSETQLIHTTRMLGGYCSPHSSSLGGLSQKHNLFIQLECWVVTASHILASVEGLGMLH